MEEDLFHVVHVLSHGRGDHFPGYRFLAFMPRIVVGAHGRERVADTGLPCEHDFRHRGHIDNVSSPHAEHLALGPGREPGSLDGDDGACGMVRYAIGRSSIDENLPQPGTERIRHRDMNNLVPLIKGARTRPRPIDELVREHEVSRLYVFSE